MLNGKQVKKQQEPLVEHSEVEGAVTPITKDSILATVKDLFGADCDCRFATGAYKKGVLLRVVFFTKGDPVSFEIREDDLVSVARSLVAIYARVRAKAIIDLSQQIKFAETIDKDKEQSEMVKKEKARF